MAKQKLKLGGKIIAINQARLYWLLLVLGLFLIFVINREFGVADNADTHRYIHAPSTTSAIMKPVEFLQEPVGGWDEEIKKFPFMVRFLTQPYFYWTPNLDVGILKSFSSGHFSFTTMRAFWTVGFALNKILYTPYVVNLKILSLPLFIIHGLFFACIFLLRKKRSLSPHTRESAPLTNCAVLLFSFLILTAANITGFYNTFYGEPMGIITILGLFAFYAAAIGNKNYMGATEKNPHNILVCLLLFLLCLVSFGKMQYIYFVIIAPLFVILFGEYLFSGRVAPRSIINLTKPVKIFLGGFVALTLIFFIINKNKNEYADIAKPIMACHMTYQGTLNFATSRQATMEKFHLPTANGDGGYWCYDKLPRDIFGYRLAMKVALAEPLGYLKFLFDNASHVGNFYMFNPLVRLDPNKPQLQRFGLGMIYGLMTGRDAEGVVGVSKDNYPPFYLMLLPALSSVLYGAGYIIASFLVGLIMLWRSFHFSPHDFSFNRRFAFLISSILFCDIFISTADGQMDLPKHLFVASIASLILWAQFFISAIHWLEHGGWKRITVKASKQK